MSSVAALPLVLEAAREDFLEGVTVKSLLSGGIIRMLLATRSLFLNLRLQIEFEFMGAIEPTYNNKFVRLGKADARKGVPRVPRLSAPPQPHTLGAGTVRNLPESEDLLLGLLGFVVSELDDIGLGGE